MLRITVITNESGDWTVVKTGFYGAKTVYEGHDRWTSLTDSLCCSLGIQVFRKTISDKEMEEISG